jgi:hypothetical protein
MRAVFVEREYSSVSTSSMLKTQLDPLLREDERAITTHWLRRTTSEASDVRGVPCSTPCVAARPSA